MTQDYTSLGAYSVNQNKVCICGSMQAISISLFFNLLFPLFACSSTILYFYLQVPKE